MRFPKETATMRRLMSQVVVAQVQQSFLANLENLLDPEQRQRLEAVRLAARLLPVVPAFQQLQLL